MPINKYLVQDGNDIKSNPYVVEEEKFSSDMSKWNLNTIGNIVGSIVDGTYQATDAGRCWPGSQGNQHQLNNVDLSTVDEFTIKINLGLDDLSNSIMAAAGIAIVDNNNDILVDIYYQDDYIGVTSLSANARIKKDATTYNSTSTGLSWGSRTDSYEITYTSNDQMVKIYKNDVLWINKVLVGMPARFAMVAYRNTYSSGQFFQKFTWDNLLITQKNKDWITVGIAPVTKTMFEEYGMPSLLDFSQDSLEQLTSPTPELLVWTDEESANRDLNLTAVPLPQMVYPIGDLNIEEIESLDIVTSKIIGKAHQNMTSDTAPSPQVASASTSYSSSYAPWRAFNGTNVDNFDCWVSQSGIKTGWLQLDFGKKVVIDKYVIASRNYSGATSAPKSWTFEGSNNASTWNILDSRTNETGWANNTRKEYTCQNQTSAYRYYRINITGNNGEAYVSIGELEMYKPVFNPKIIASGDGGQNWKTVQTYTEDAVPSMTSENTPSGIATHSNAFSDAIGTCAAWKVFNNTNTGSYDEWMTHISDPDPWLAYEFDSQTTIGKYTITCANHSTGPGRAPKAWTFEGWNGSDWKVLDVRFNETAWTRDQKRIYDIAQPGSYKKYRIKPTANNGDSYYSIGEMELIKASEWLSIDPLGKETISLYVDAIPPLTSNTTPEGKAEASSTHSTVQPYFAFDKINVSEGNSSWITDMTQNSWLSYEFSSPKRIEKYTIMGQMNGGTTTDANLITRSPKSWTFEGRDGSQWIVLDTQSNITSWSIGQKKEFMFTNPNTYSKYRINVSANCGNAYLAIGEMEMMEKIENEVPIIKTQGMTPTTLNTITQDQWKQLATNGKLRLAYYLEQSSTSDVCQIDSLTVNENVVTLTPIVEKLGINYELLEGRRPTYYASRDDGVTWKEVKVDQLTSLSDQPTGTKLRIKAVMNDGEEIYGIAYSWM